MLSQVRFVPVGLAALAILAGPALGAEGAKKAQGKGGAAAEGSIEPREALRQGALALWAIEKAKAQVAKYLVEARQKKDVIRINCVQEKLARLNTVVEIARQTLKRLRQEAPRDETGDASRLLYEKMMLLKEQAQGLRRDAESCSGEEMSYTGATKVFFEQDKSIPREDPSDPPSGFDPFKTGFERPPEVSGYY